MPAPAPQIASTVSGSDRAAVAGSGGESPVVIAWTDPSPTSASAPQQAAPADVAPQDDAEAATVADAFSGFSLEPSNPAPAATGAVDITRIDIPRERPAPPPPPPPPPPPAYPSRHWVQVATGKDLSALKFDWRRISRKAEGKLDGKGPFVTKWVEANRLLAGPYDSAAKAREMVKELKGMGIDSFTFTSAKGEKIDDL